MTSKSRHFLDQDSLVESKIESFVEMRQSQLANESMRRQQALNAPELKENSKITRNPLKFLKQPNKEMEYLQKMTETEKVRLYTKLCVENGKLENQIRDLKVEYITLRKQNDGDADKELDKLKKENVDLKFSLKQLTRELTLKQKVNRKDVLRPKKKTLVKTIGNRKQAKRKPVKFANKRQVQQRIDELKLTLVQTNNQISKLHDFMNKAGIPIQFSDGTAGGGGLSSKHGPSQDLWQKSISELDRDIIEIQAQYDSISGENKIVQRGNSEIENRIQEINIKLSAKQEENMALENKLLQFRAQNPQKLQSELSALKRREIELTRRITDLEGNPFYKGASGTQSNTLIRLNEAQSKLVDIRAQFESQQAINQKKQQEVDDLSSKLDTKSKERLILKEQLVRARTLFEANQKKQNDMIAGGMTPQMIAKLSSQDKKDDEIPDPREEDALMKTLGIIKWKGEDPAWLKLDFLEKMRKFDTDDPDQVRKEYVRLTDKKVELSSKLDKVQTILKSHVDLEQKRRQENLLQKKRKENELMRLEEKIKDLQEVVDRINVANRKATMTKNPRTGENMVYNDAVSVFSENNSDLFHTTQSENLLDIFIGKVRFEKFAVQDLLLEHGLSNADINNLSTVCSINFYDHPALNSGVKEGYESNYNFRGTFAFSPSKLMLDYMHQAALSIDVFRYGDQASNCIGTAKIMLIELIERNMSEGRQDSIGVLISNARIMSKRGKLLGVLSFRLRTRLPIYADLLRYRELNAPNRQDGRFNLDIKHLGKERVLNVEVVQAQGLNPNSQSYTVVRMLNFEDIISQSVRGSNPRYNLRRQMTMMYSEELRSSLRNSRVEFVVFDDNVPYQDAVVERKEGTLTLKDLLGSGELSTMPLIHDKVITQKIYLKNQEGTIRGSLLVRIFWEGTGGQDPIGELGYDRQWEDTISLKICQAFKIHDLTVNQAFKLVDEDESQTISKKEFFKIVIDTLGVSLTSEESTEYWQRVSGGNDLKELTYSRFLMYFGPFLNSSMLGAYGRQQGGLRGDISKINALFNSGDIDPKAIDKIDARLASIIQQVSACMKLYQSRKKVSNMELFDLFDTNNDNRITRIEFITLMEDTFKVPVQPRDLEFIYDYLNPDQDKGIDVREFYKLLKFDMASFEREKRQREKELRQGGAGDSPTNKNKVIFDFLTEVKDKLAKEKISAFKLFSLIDKNGNGSVTKSELRKFIKSYFDLKWPKDKLEIIIFECDQDNDDQIQVKEFMDFIKAYDSIAMLQNPGKLNSIQSSRVLQVLFEEMNDKEKEPVDFMIEIDTDQNGQVDNFELGSYLKQVGKGRVSYEDIESFVYLFDKDGNGQMSTEELKTALEIYQRAIEMERPIPPLVREALLEKLIPIINHNKPRLRKAFFTREVQGNPGWIKVDSFRQVLNNTTLFDEQEVEMIINPLCIIKTKYGKIQYEGFLELKDTQSQHRKMQESSILMMRGGKLIKRLFVILKKVAFRHNLDTVGLFNIFDVKTDGYLSIEDFRAIFRRMDIDLSEDQIEDIVKELDANGDARISYAEFSRHITSVEVPGMEGRQLS